MNNDRATIETPIHGSSWPMTGRNRSSAPNVPTTTISRAASTCRRRKVPCSARRAALTSQAIDVPSVRIRTSSHAQPKSAAGSGPVATSVGEIVWSIDEGRASTRFATYARTTSRCCRGDGCPSVATRSEKSSVAAIANAEVSSLTTCATPIASGDPDRRSTRSAAPHAASAIATAANRRPAGDGERVATTRPSHTPSSAVTSSAAISKTCDAVT